MMTESTPSQNPSSAQALSQETKNLKQETLSEQTIQDEKKGCGTGCLTIVILLLIFFAKPLYDFCMALAVFGMPSGFSFVWSREFHGATWKEEVQLHDGSVVLVKRRIIGNGRLHSRTLKFFDVEEERLEVLDAHGEALTPKFIIPWRTLLLDKTEDGKWFTVVAHYGDIIWGSCFAYKQYVLEANGWQQVKFDERLKGRISNLTWGYLDDLNNMPKLIKLSDKPFGYTGKSVIDFYKITFPTLGGLGCEHDDFSN